MKSRRRTSIIILVAASVFLCLISSCGIPTYLVPKITPTKGTTDYPYTAFSIKYSGDNVGEYGKVGLILLYYPDTGVVDSSDNSKIVNKFSSNYKVSTNDGIVIDVYEDKPLFEIPTSKTESGTGKVYPFELEGKAVESPTYTIALDTAGDFNSVIKLEYVLIDDTYKIQMTVDGEVQPTYLTLNDDINLSTTPYLNIYAAVSVQSSQYSNIFWSSLWNVGTIRFSE